jgi:hypothetical protein
MKIAVIPKYGFKGGKMNSKQGAVREEERIVESTGNSQIATDPVGNTRYTRKEIKEYHHENKINF